MDFGNTINGIGIIGGSGNRIGGLSPEDRNVISGNGQFGVEIFASSMNLVAGNLIGTDASGATGVGNSLGVAIRSFSNNNVLGGMAAGARNVISGNLGRGVLVNGSSTANVIQGNYIGTDVSGTGDLGNGSTGMVIVAAQGNTIGGTVPGAGNVISGNDAGGIIIEGPIAHEAVATANLVQGNLIGTDTTGSAPLGNSGPGVYFRFSPIDNVVGGATGAEANTIAFNAGAGVKVDSGAANAVLANSIYSNAGLGIDLGTGGVTPNDAGDVDSGPNNLQNYPVITSALIENGDLLIQYSVDSSVGSSTYPLLVQFFIADADGQEGKTFLGSDTYATSTAKVARLSGAFALGLRPGDVIVATAPDANTSEFSLATTATTVVAVPVLAPWALVLVAVLFAGVVGWRRRLAMREPR